MMIPDDTINKDVIAWQHEEEEQEESLLCRESQTALLMLHQCDTATTVTDATVHTDAATAGQIASSNPTIPLGSFTVPVPAPLPNLCHSISSSISVCMPSSDQEIDSLIDSWLK